MNHIWTFSEESKELLQRCLDAAEPTNESNKWTQLFRRQNENMVRKSNFPITIEDSPEYDVIIEPNKQEKEVVTHAEEYEDPDFDIILKFNNLQEKKAGNTKIKEFAENLPLNTLEKLNKHIFNNENINPQVLSRYFKYILPVYIKRDNSRNSTELLYKTFKLYSDNFKTLIKVVLKDLDIHNNIINDFILSLNATEVTDFLNNLINIEFTSEEFAHNLFNITTAYKNCNKTDNVQKIILSLLKTHSQYCTSDKNYGKLLLAFMQHEKSFSKILDTADIKQLVETHNSAFKRPCIVILKEIDNN